MPAYISTNKSSLFILFFGLLLGFYWVGISFFLASGISALGPIFVCAVRLAPLGCQNILIHRALRPKSAPPSCQELKAIELTEQLTRDN